MKATISFRNAFGIIISITGDAKQIGLIGWTLAQLNHEFDTTDNSEESKPELIYKGISDIHLMHME
jgi:hypothetical protein